MQATELLSRIEGRLAELKMSARAASLKTGRGADVIRNIQRAVARGEEYQPRPGTIEDLAFALDVDLLWLLTGDQGKPVINETMDSRITVYDGFEDVEGKMAIGHQVTTSIARLDTLDKAWTSFGIRLQTDTFSPIYEVGDILVAGWTLTPRKGDECLIQFQDHTATIRRFVERRGARWIFHERGSDKLQEMDERDFTRLSVIVARMMR